MSHERKSTWLSLRITQRMDTAIRTVAARKGTTPSDAARELLTRALQLVDTQPPEPRERAH